MTTHTTPYTKVVECWLCEGEGTVRVTYNDVLAGPELSGFVARIIGEVADECGITSADMMGKSRTQRCVYARDIAVRRLRHELDMTLKQIGQALGGRHHTTILHSLTKNGVL